MPETLGQFYFHRDVFFFLWLGLPILGLSFLPCLLTWWLGSGAVRLLRDGVAVVGVVLRAHPEEHGISYQFTAAGGEVLTAGTIIGGSRSRIGWKPGDAILVVYDPADLSRSEADVFRARGDDLKRLLSGGPEREVSRS